MCLLLEVKFHPPQYPQNPLKNVNGSTLLYLSSDGVGTKFFIVRFLMTRKNLKNKNKLSRPTTTKKAMVTSMLMPLKENKTHKNKLYFCNMDFSLQFSINTYKTQHSQQLIRAGRRNTQRTAKCYYFSLESCIIIFL